MSYICVFLIFGRFVFFVYVLWLIATFFAYMILKANNNTAASRTQLSGQFAKGYFVMFSRLEIGTDQRTEEES